MRHEGMNEFDEHEDDGCELCAMMGIEQVILLEELERRGYRVRPPGEVPADGFADALRELATELAKVRVFLEFTDHLDDEALYRRLYDETLQEWSWVSPDDAMGATHIDFTGSGSDEDHDVWLTYYADDEERAEALRWDPRLVLPERKPLPFDRSNVLPRPTYGVEPDA